MGKMKEVYQDLVEACVGTEITAGEMLHLIDLLEDYKKVYIVIKSGLRLKDFQKEEYKDLPIDWVYNLLIK